VTVDMIATGTDVKPLECLVFMRSVKSRTYFEQMLGRGVRIIGDTDFQSVTEDAKSRDGFIVVDAVGVTNTPLVETMQPLERKPAQSLQSLPKVVGFGNRDPEVASTIAGTPPCSFALPERNGPVSGWRVLPASATSAGQGLGGSRSSEQEEKFLAERQRPLRNRQRPPKAD
jgi:superfamily II DNA or RNA helicase